LRQSLDFAQITRITQIFLTDTDSINLCNPCNLCENKLILTAAIFGGHTDCTDCTDLLTDTGAIKSV